MLIFLLVIFIDQWTKFHAADWGFPVSVNFGFSFGLFSGSANILNVLGIVFGAIAMFVVVWMMVRHFMHSFALAMFFGAAFSNILDRLMFHGVRDWLPLPWFGIVNNLADWVIFLTVLWYVVQCGHGKRA